MNLNFKNILISYSFLVSSFFIAQEDGGSKLRINRSNPIIKTRIGFSPVLGLYTIRNTFHAQNPKQKLSFCVSVKEEIRLNKKNNSFLMFGVEYMQHGVNFNSFYFYPDSLKLYTGKMNANYALTIHELNFPIQLKYSIQKETNSVFSNYVYAGYCYRWAFASSLTVANNGEEIVKQSSILKFKSPAFNPYSSSFYSVGFGIQKNNHRTYSAIFAELQLKFAPSPFYINESFSPANLYINGHFMYITIGCKF